MAPPYSPTNTVGASNQTRGTQWIFPYAIINTVTTSSTGLHGDLLILTTKDPTKVFILPNGATAPAPKLAKLHHQLRKPAHTVDMVPYLVQNTLLSASKFANAEYISIYDGDKVNVYDGHTTRIKVSEKVVLKGWI